MTPSTFLSREPAWTDADFVGRNTALTWLAGQLGRETPQNCNLVGEPRIGKTSLLHAVYRRKIGLPAGGKGVYVWARLVEWANRQPSAFWAQLLERTRAAGRETGLALPAAEAEAHAAPTDSAWAAYRGLERLLECWQSEAAPPRVIVLLDDFETLIPDITAQGLDWLRALATRFASILAFVITTTDPLEQACRRLEAEQVSPLPNIFTTYHLGLLTDEETSGLVCAAAEAEGRPPIAAALATFLRYEVGRHPDLLKLGCDYLFQAQDETGAVADLAEIMDAVRSDVRYDDHARWLCNHLYARRTEDERIVIRNLVGEQATDDPPLLRRLERKLGVVESRGSKPTLFADTCRYWVMRHQAAAAAHGESDKPRLMVPKFHYQAELRELRIGDQTHKLSAVEDRLFQYLLSKPNQVCAAKELLGQVWGAERKLSVVEKSVNRLRDKVEQDPGRPRLILSARGEGYLLRAPDKE